jgi:hypothetical protein
MDAWTKTAPDGTTIVFKKEGSEEAAFVYTAEGRTITETQAMEEELTREEVEALFGDYVAGMGPATE